MLRACVLLSILYCVACWQKANFLGCYKDLPSIKTFHIQQYRTLEQCSEDCANKYYRYAYIRNEGQCICGNYLGEQVSSNVTCEIYCETCDLKPNLTDIYATGNLVPGPPRNVRITNITETSLRISWQEPESYVDLTSYQIKALILHTYSSYSPMSPEWTYSNNTFKTELINLLPATKYNITVSAKSPNGNGAVFSNIIETVVGEPDNVPTQPTIVDHSGTTMTVSLLPVLNNNGPITSYRIVVVDDDSKQTFEKNNLFPYEEAKRNGWFYYIAAELSPNAISKNFLIGDGKRYGKYYNAPLNPNVNYNVLLGVVSELKGVTKVTYSNLSGTVNGVLILNVNNPQSTGDNPTVIIGLSIAIGLLSFMFIAGIIGFIILKSKVTNRRQRLSDNQELTLQGPMIEVENNGYIHEEDAPVNHYRSLKQKVRTVSSNQLKIEPTTLLGVGKFGRVNSGTIQENNTSIPIAAYSIADKKMSQEIRRGMLQELDLLIRSGKHPNVIGFIGTCETPQMVCVVLELATMNLKDLLLGSREALPGRFSNMSEVQALDIAVQIAQGMAHLTSCKIIHKQLCTRSVMITNGFTPKISGFGLAQYFSHNKMPDFTRWTALEVFEGRPHNPKSDVWSFACLLWEICVLGGTPYGNVSNNEIPERIIRGLRLPQMQYFSDDLYQLMLDCWQIDFDERPQFAQLVESLENLKDNTLIPYLNFNLYSNFQYEQFYPDMEVAVRPNF